MFARVVIFSSRVFTGTIIDFLKFTCKPDHFAKSFQIALSSDKCASLLPMIMSVISTLDY
jgi:hypothetical protein